MSSRLTLVPPLMPSPNQTGLLALGLDFVHQDFLGILAGLAEMQVSPLSMLQKTLMESLMLPWFGSIQYSPGQKKEFWLYVGPKDSSTLKKKAKEPHRSSFEGSTA